MLMGRDVSHRRQATPAASQCHGRSPPAMAGMGTWTGVTRLHSTAATALLLAADETQAAAAKIRSKDAPRFPRWRASIWAAEVLGEEKQEQTLEGKEGIPAQQTCLRAACYTLLLPKYSHCTGVMQRSWGLHHRRKRDQEERRKEMPRTAPPLLTLQSPPSCLKNTNGNKRIVE